MSLVRTAVLPPLAGQGFAVTAGSVSDARCRARAAPRRAPHGLRRGGGRGETRGRRPGPGPGQGRRGTATRDCRRWQRDPAPAGLVLKPFRGDDPDCVAVRGARVPARSCLSFITDGDEGRYFQDRNVNSIGPCAAGQAFRMAGAAQRNATDRFCQVGTEAWTPAQDWGSRWRRRVTPRQAPAGFETPLWGAGGLRSFAGFCEEGTFRPQVNQCFGGEAPLSYRVS